MLSYNHAFYELRTLLQPLYDEREATAISHEILFFITGHNKADRLIHKDTMLSSEQHGRYEMAVRELLSGKPLQYVTGTAWFMGKEFEVNENVLIPRPETEELVEWVINDWKSREEKIDILDIGTGSGCIPISLTSALLQATVTACDISEAALQVAKQNAEKLSVTVSFLQLDFLDTIASNKLGNYDVIVSNPPYIPAAERGNMHINVKDYEPAIALFVPDNDPLLFYKAIASFGKQHLNSNGYIYCELDAGHAAMCKELFERAGYRNVALRKDIHGNLRMLKAGISERYSI